MMCRRWKRAVFAFFLCLFTSILLCGGKVNAGEGQTLPEGEILLIYTDGISNDGMDHVMNIVRELTCQSFQVTYAPASKCLGQLEGFSSIMCYDITRYPKGLIEELYEREQAGNTILRQREDAENSSGENDIRLLFVGNSFLRSYLKETGRGDSYVDSSKQVGKMQYSFDGMEEKEALVKEEDFLFMTGELDYRRGRLEVAGTEGYFCARMGSLYHIAATDIGDRLVKAAFVLEAARWKWPFDGDPHVYAQYMVLNEVYPFQNPDKLLEIVNYLIDRKVPFVISVMPVYHNGDYPAMQHFCEVLRYAQANGGVIVIHSPINQMTEFDADLVNEYLTAAISIYMDQGVYPMGLQVPGNWLFNSKTIEVMSRFRTVLLTEEEDPLIMADEGIYTNQVYRDGHQWISPAIALDLSGVSFLKVSSSAVYFDISDDMETIINKVQACITSEVPLKSLWDIEHSFWTDEDVMNYRNRIILVNNKRIENRFTATEYAEDFQYNRNMLQRFSKDLSEENSKLLLAVIVVSGLFLWFILTARHRNKKRFFIRHPLKEYVEPTEQELEEKLGVGSAERQVQWIEVSEGQGGFDFDYTVFSDSDLSFDIEDAKADFDHPGIRRDDFDCIEEDEDWYFDE